MGKGRPKKKIDQQQFEGLCGLQCTSEEICCFFNCDKKTLYKWVDEVYKTNFSTVFKAKRGKGMISLRRTQFRLAETSPAMAIFLGKQFLNQSDKHQQSDLDIEEQKMRIAKMKAEIKEPLKESDKVNVCVYLPSNGRNE